MKIWIIRHVDYERLGHIPGILDELKLPYRSISLAAGDSLPPLDEVRGVITMGGPMSSNDKLQHDWIEREEQFVRRVHEQGIPLLGICLGAQILAQAFGAHVRKAKSCEVGWLPLIKTDLQDDRLLDGVEIPPLFQFHYDTFDLPAGAVNLLKSAQTEHQMFRLGKTSYGIQFHSEANEEMLKGICQQYQDELSHDLVAAILENVPQNSAAGRRFLVQILGRLFV